MVRRSLSAGDVLNGADVMRPGDHGFLAAVLRPGMRAVTVGRRCGQRHGRADLARRPRGRDPDPVDGRHQAAARPAHRRARPCCRMRASSPSTRCSCRAAARRADAARRPHRHARGRRRGCRARAGRGAHRPARPRRARRRSADPCRPPPADHRSGPATVSRARDRRRRAAAGVLRVFKGAPTERSFATDVHRKQDARALLLRPSGRHQRRAGRTTRRCARPVSADARDRGRLRPGAHLARRRGERVRGRPQGRRSAAGESRNAIRLRRRARAAPRSPPSTPPAMRLPTRRSSSARRASAPRRRRRRSHARCRAAASPCSRRPRAS